MSGDGDRSRDHLGMTQPSSSRKNKSRRLIEADDIPSFVSSTLKHLEQRSIDTHIYVVPFGTANPLDYHPHYRRPASASSSSQSLPPPRYTVLPTEPYRRVRPLSANRISSAMPSPSPSSTDLASPHLSSMGLRDSSTESDGMAATPPLTQHYIPPDVSHPHPPPPDATLDEPLELAPGQKDRLGRVVIEPDGSSWHPSKPAARALQEIVRRLYTEPYHSWSVIPNRIRQTMFNEFKTSCTWQPKYNMVIATTFERKTSARLSSRLKVVRDSMTPPSWMLPHIFEELCHYWETTEFKAMSDQAKKVRGSLKGGSLHTGGAKSIGTITRKMEKELGRPPLRCEIFKKKINESDPDEWVEERASQSNDMYQRCIDELGDSVQLTPEESSRIWTEKVVGGTHKGRVYGMGSQNDVRRLQSGLQGIGSSRQAEALDNVQMAEMSRKISDLTRALAESEERRLAEQRAMDQTIEQIKEQVLNLARRPSRSSRASISDDDSSEEEEYIAPTPP